VEITRVHIIQQQRQCLMSRKGTLLGMKSMALAEYWDHIGYTRRHTHLVVM